MAIYSDPKLYKVQEVKGFLEENNINSFVEGIIGLAMYSDERDKVKELTINTFLESNNDKIRIACIKALSHIVRIDKNLKEENVLDELSKLREIDTFSSSIEDLLDDIKIFQK